MRRLFGISKIQTAVALVFWLEIWSVSPLYADSKIEWRVTNPFRFFKKDSDFQIHRWAYEDVLKDVTDNRLSELARQNNLVSTVERKLNNPSWWDSAKITMLNNLRKEEGRERNEEYPKNGWASLLRLDAATCWDHLNQRFQYRSQSCPHKVEVWLAGGKSTQHCTWVSGKPINKIALAKCDQRLLFEVPANTEITIKVSTSESGKAISVEEKISVEEILIVGLGDSMASGEGNPDVPVRLHPRAFLQYAYDDYGVSPALKFLRELGYPRRDETGEAAYWIDRRCHRSAYSHQLRAALAIALENSRYPESQHRSVTFLSFACSGAEIIKGLLDEYEGKEAIEVSNDRKRQSQLNALIEAICETEAGEPIPFQPVPQIRMNSASAENNNPDDADLVDSVKLRPCNKIKEIDLLFITIGVNDLGFTNLISNLILEHGEESSIFFTRDKLRTFVNVIEIERARKQLGLMKERFQFLQAAISKKLRLKDQNQKRVIFTTYPSLLTNADNRICEVGRATMTFSELFEIRRPDFAVALNGLKADFSNKLKEYIEPFNWTYNDGHLRAFEGHGFCATRQDGPGESGKGSAEKIQMPYKKSENGEYDSWRHFDPSTELYPYEKRTRWFRTMNDDYLITNFMKKKYDVDPSKSIKIDSGDKARMISGAFHPTAEGHSHIADALVKEACKILECKK